MTHPQRTAQEWLDFCVAAIHAQGHASVDAGRGCVYRTIHGDKCVVGHAIPDSEYTPSIEGLSPMSLFDHPDQPVQPVLPFQWFQPGGCLYITDLPTPMDMRRFWSGLQQCHDGAANPVPLVVEGSAFLKAFDLNVYAFACGHNLRAPLHLTPTEEPNHD